MEGAIALSALVVVFGLLLAGFAIVSDQLRCTSAAGEAARLVARGQPQQAEAAVRQLAPDGATFEVASEGRRVAVTVRAEPANGLLPGVSAAAKAYAELEQGVAAAGEAATPDGEAHDHAPP